MQKQDNIILEYRYHGSHPQHRARGQNLLEAPNNQPIKGPGWRHVAGVRAVLNHIPRRLLLRNITEAERDDCYTCGLRGLFQKTLTQFSFTASKIRENVQQYSAGR